MRKSQFLALLDQAAFNYASGCGSGWTPITQALKSAGFSSEVIGSEGRISPLMKALYADAHLKLTPIQTMGWVEEAWDYVESFEIQRKAA